MKIKNLSATVELRRGDGGESREFLVDGRAVGLSVVRSPRAKRFILKVANGSSKVVLTIPARARIADALDFAQSQTQWVAERIALIPEPVAFVANAIVPVRGIDHRISPQSGGRGAVWQEDSSRGPLLCVAGDIAHLPRRLRDWMKREARSDLDEAVMRYARTLRVRPRRISLRDQNSRWGSCSAGGTLSFSWRLIMAPPMVLDYVAAHEVAHMRQMNHSTKFWAHVARVCPHMDEARDWLRANGAELHRYGAEA